MLRSIASHEFDLMTWLAFSDDALRSSHRAVSLDSDGLTKFLAVDDDVSQKRDCGGSLL